MGRIHSGRLQALGLLFSFGVASAIAQAPAATAEADAWAAILGPLAARALGPTTMGGRVTDIAVYEKQPSIYYVASASGGLFKTKNAGLQFTPVFEKETSISLGAVAVSQTNPDVVWVGTGEYTSRNSVAWGDGVYKSVDGGKTWSHMGLQATMHIGKIVIDPRNPDVVYVAALGRMWGSNPERGVYKTTDGGKTWKQILTVDDRTGAVDLQMDPKDPGTLLCSMWQRVRTPSDFISGGPGSGLYKTTNGGKWWRKITKGLPGGPYGKIGINYYRSDPKVVLATVEYKPDMTKEPTRPKPGGQVPRFGGGTFVSEDGGDSWKMVNPLNPRPFYFSVPRMDPADRQRIYIPADGLNLSVDGGKTFKQPDVSFHPDVHAFWINPTDSSHIIIGCDGGVFESHDKSETWRHLDGLPIGQYYAASVDMRRPYWVYGGLQDNQCWGIPTQSIFGAIQSYSSVPLGGGDGFYTQVDPTDWTTVYSESQGGAASRMDLRTGRGRGIQPSIPGERLRFNWNTPFILSPHNPRTIYFGANRLMKSVNRGDSWKPVSPDLTTNDPSKQSAGKLSVSPEATGAEMHCTIVTVSESPIRPGLLWVGTDDGNVQVSKDDGVSWINVAGSIPNVPKGLWCSRVTASKWVEGRAYVLFDGHRSNDFHAYAYVTEDFGKTWTSISAGLADNDSLYVIREGLQNKDLLFLGSEMSLRASLDRGKTWGRIRNNFPTVAVHDLLIHPKELDLVVATHGRSLYTVDVSGLEQLDSSAMAKDVALFVPQDILILGKTNGGQWDGDRGFAAPNTQPGTRIMFYLKSPAKTTPKITVTDASGERSSELSGVTNNAGLNVVSFSGRVEGRAAPGDYRVVLTVDGKEYTTAVHVEEAILNKG